MHVMDTWFSHQIQVVAELHGRHSFTIPSTAYITVGVMAQGYVLHCLVHHNVKMAHTCPKLLPEQYDINYALESNSLKADVE